MIFIPRTRAVADKLINDVKNILFCVTIIVQVIFFGFYGYSIYKNVRNTIYLILYSVLALLSTLSFVYYLITRKEKSKTLNKFRRFLRVLKYFVNGGMVVVSGIALIGKEATDINLILLTLSGISLIIQVAIELLRVFTERYVELFSVALEGDLWVVEKMINPKNSILDAIDAPLEAIANKIQNKTKEIEEVNPTKLYVEELKEEFEKKNKIKEEKKEEEVSNKKKEIIEHISIIKDKIFNKKAK